MTLTVSVITPSFNQGNLIERTIQSVLSQKFKGLEYVVFDGGSTDQTIDIFKRYDGELVWVSEKDKGQTNAVNKGILATSGEIIGWLNSDDIYFPGAIKMVCEYFELHPEVDIIYGKAYHIDEKDQIIRTYDTERWDLEGLKNVCYICQPAVFFRRSVTKRFGLLDERLQYCMDYEYWLRLGGSGAKFFYMDYFYLAGSRFYPDTKTLKNRVQVHREINLMMREHFGGVPDRWVFNYAHVIVEAKGIDRNCPFLFALTVSLISFFSALLWNKRISRGSLNTLFSWIKGGFSQLFRKDRN
jgi:glycosyltransferase involved in cell wall biosynthesis